MALLKSIDAQGWYMVGAMYCNRPTLAVILIRRKIKIINKLYCRAPDCFSSWWHGYCFDVTGLELPEMFGMGRNFFCYGKNIPELAEIIFS